MKIEFLILADAAQVVEGKLYMLGGGWSVHRAANYPSQIQFAACISVLVPWDEAGMRHPFTVTVADEAGVAIAPPLEGQFEIGKSAQTPAGMTQRTMIAINFNMMVLPRPGKYAVVAAAGPSKAETRFDAIFAGRKAGVAPGIEPPERGN